MNTPTQNPQTDSCSWYGMNALKKHNRVRMHSGEINSVVFYNAA